MSGVTGLATSPQITSPQIGGQPSSEDSLNAGWLSLPGEMFTQHMMRLHVLDPTMIGRLRRVSTFFHRLFGTGAFWKALYEQDFKLPTTLESAFAAYRRKILLPQNLFHGFCKERFVGHLNSPPTFMKVIAGRLILFSHTTQIWDLESKLPPVLLGNFTAIAANQHILVLSDGVNDIRIYDLQSNQWLPQEANHGASETALAIQSDRIISGGKDGSVKVWNRFAMAATSKENSRVAGLIAEFQGRPGEKVLGLAITCGKIFALQTGGYSSWDLKGETWPGGPGGMIALGEFLILSDKKTIDYVNVLKNQHSRRNVRLVGVNFVDEIEGMLVSGDKASLSFWRMEREVIEDQKSDLLWTTIDLAGNPTCIAFFEGTLFVAYHSGNVFAYDYLAGDDAILAQIKDDHRFTRHEGIPKYVFQAIEEKLHALRLAQPLLPENERYNQAIAAYLQEHEPKEVKQ